MGEDMDFKNISKGNKVYIVFFIAGIMSLFMDWVKLDSISYNGFQQQGWIILIPLAFILFTKLTGKLYSRGFNLVLSSVVCLLTIFFLFDKTVYINNEAYYGDLYTRLCSFIYKELYKGKEIIS